MLLLYEPKKFNNNNTRRTTRLVVGKILRNEHWEIERINKNQLIVDLHSFAYI